MSSLVDTYFEGDIERHAAKLRLEDIVERERSVGIRGGVFEREWLRKHRPFSSPLHKAFHRMPQTSFTGIPDNLAGFPTAAFAARNTSAAELSMLGDTANGAPPAAMIQQFCALSPNDARAGKSYEVMFGASYGITGTPTIIFTPRWGSSTTIGTNVSLGVSPTMTTVASPTNFFGHFVFGIRTAPPGATLGTGIGHGFVLLGNSGTTPYGIHGVVGGTAATIDTSGQGTAGLGLQFGVTWGTSSASNTYTPQWYIVRSIN
jgi:hypothetical protein